MLANLVRRFLSIFAVVSAAPALSSVPDTVHVGLRGSRAANRAGEVKHGSASSTSEVRLPLDPPRHLADMCSAGDSVYCADGVSRCAGNQCCPDGTVCPSAMPDWAACPGGKKTDCTTGCAVDAPVFCSDGVTSCAGKQCCPDGMACPSAKTGWAECPAGRVSDCTMSSGTAAQPTTTASVSSPSHQPRGGKVPPPKKTSGRSSSHQLSGGKASAACSVITDRSKRQLVLKNSCSSDRVFQFNWQTTPLWVPRPVDLGSPQHNRYLAELTTMSCAAGSTSCDGLRFVDGKTTNSIFGTTACIKGRCIVNPYFTVAPGGTHTIDLVENWESATMSLAMDCDEGRYNCQTGGPTGGLFEFTYDSDLVWYDTSAVDGWSKAANMAATVCAADRTPVNVTGDGFWCGISQCSFDPSSHCPDGSDAQDSDYYVPGDSYNATAISLLIAGVGLDKQAQDNCAIAGCGGYKPHTFNGGFDNHISNRMYVCNITDGTSSCVKTEDASQANTCLSGCMDCERVTRKDARSAECAKYCCPDYYSPYFGPYARFDSATCSAIGVQKSTDYTRHMAKFCPSTYSYGYNDHSATYTCHNSVSLVIEACPTP